MLPKLKDWNEDLIVRLQRVAIESKKLGRKNNNGVEALVDSYYNCLWLQSAVNPVTSTMEFLLYVLN